MDDGWQKRFTEGTISTVWRCSSLVIKCILSFRCITLVHSANKKLNSFVFVEYIKWSFAVPAFLQKNKHTNASYDSYK